MLIIADCRCHIQVKTCATIKVLNADITAHHKKNTGANIDIKLMYIESDHNLYKHLERNENRAGQQENA